MLLPSSRALLISTIREEEYEKNGVRLLPILSGSSHFYASKATAVRTSSPVIAHPLGLFSFLPRQIRSVTPHFLPVIAHPLGLFSFLRLAVVSLLASIAVLLPILSGFSHFYRCRKAMILRNRRRVIAHPLGLFSFLRGIDQDENGTFLMLLPILSGSSHFYFTFGLRVAKHLNSVIAHPLGLFSFLLLFKTRTCPNCKVLLPILSGSSHFYIVDIIKPIYNFKACYCPSSRALLISTLQNN